MACWPGYLVGSLSLSILIFDLIVKDWSSLLPHAIGGVITTVVIWGLCFISTALASAVLVVPLFAALVFFITLYITRQSLIKRGCCMKCQPDPEPTPSCGSPPKPSVKCYDNTLKATPVM
jgi:hypothetical protein